MLWGRKAASGQESLLPPPACGSLRELASTQIRMASYIRSSLYCFGGGFMGIIRPLKEQVSQSSA